MTLQRVVLKRRCASGRSVLWLGHILTDVAESIYAKQENNAYYRVGFSDRRVRQLRGSVTLPTDYITHPSTPLRAAQVDKRKNGPSFLRCQLTSVTKTPTLASPISAA